MLLSCAIRIFVDPNLAKSHCEYAHELLLGFVEDAEQLYGQDILVYNVHGLIHLAADLKPLGCLDNFSCFPFENKLGKLIKLVRKPQFLLEQLVRRLSEIENCSPVSSQSTADEFSPSLKARSKDKT